MADSDMVDLDDARGEILESMRADDRQTAKEYQSACSALNAVFTELRVARDRLATLESAREGAPGRIAHALDDTRGYHVSVLDDDTRNEFMHRLTRAAFDPSQPTSWNPVPPEKP